jgi:superfamily II DNA/RNA helicase
VVTLVHGRAEGNPFFTEELLKALLEQGAVNQSGDRWARKQLSEIEVPHSVRSVVGGGPRSRIAGLEGQHTACLRHRAMKMLLFTEHKDTLDYLAGDGKEGRPLGKLREWGLSVTTIHGGMKIGDRDTPGSRIYAEREFRDEAQVLVATEAAGEGINLQFCWFMINFDIPWNPVRLEQRMGRIHRYGQEHDCLIFNFVARNTREGRVLDKLLDRLWEIHTELGTDQVFDVVGEIFPGVLLERLFRDLYARRTTVPDIASRIVRDVDPARFRAITQSTLEGLAKKELNLSAVVGKSVEAKERRLVPEVIESFFREAAPLAGVLPRETARGSHVYRIGRVPRTLIPPGQQMEPRFGRLGREYQKVASPSTSCSPTSVHAVGMRRAWRRITVGSI